MKDFAKSIHVGNATEFELRSIKEREDSLRQAEKELRRAEEEYKKNPSMLNKEELYGAKRGYEMAKDNLERVKRNVRNSKAGNKKVGNNKVDNIKQDEKAKKLYDEMMDAKEIAEEWAKAIHSQPKDNLENGRKAAEEAYRKAKRAYEEYAMNSKTGNDTPAEYAKRPPKIVGGNSLNEELEKDVEKKDKEKVEDVEELKKTGNADDKFAYVMREFEEGKLKTPDGKVVTDPAQAKAIAYSESKKTENGLARARNAIKK